MKILFQGDSITDACRDRSDYHNLAGYALYTAEILGDGNEYIDLGISGDRSIDILNRYERDIKDIAPDVMTILIGINDVWRRYDSNAYTSPEEYERNLKTILSKVKSDLPETKIIVIEPFLLPASDKRHWRRDLAEVIEAARNVAVEYADGYVPMDGIFAKQRLSCPWQKLSEDGVHPAEEGHKLIAKYLAEEILLVAKKAK